MKHVFYLFGLLTCLLTITWTVHANDWQAEIKKFGIETYSRTVEGSDMLEIRSITVVDARIEVIAELLRDVPANPLWRPNCMLSLLIHAYDRSNMITYHVIDLPWPIYDRDVAVRAETTLDLDRGKALVNLWAIDHPSVPPRNDRVRITEFYSQYILVYINREKTGIVFTTKANPGGKIPSFVANFFSKRYAYEEIVNMREMLKRQKYIDLGNQSEDKKLIETIVSDQNKIKQIYKSRLEEFIKDNDFIFMIVSNQKMIDTFSSGNSEIDILLLYGMGLKDSKIKAIQRLLEDYAQTITQDTEKINYLVNDDTLITMILEGTRPKETSIQDMIHSRL